jgi:lipopolysaccharide biosynthesis protein
VVTLPAWTSARARIRNDMPSRALSRCSRRPVTPCCTQPRLLMIDCVPPPKKKVFFFIRSLTSQTGAAEGSSKRLLRAIDRIKYYPMILMLASIAPTINRM